MTKITTGIALLMLNQFFILPEAFAMKTLKDCHFKEITLADKSSCLDGVKEAIDREMQTWVNNHIFNLEEKALSTGRYSALKMFKRSQSDFITFRDNDCRWQYLAKSPDKEANIIYKECYVKLTRTRISELSNVQ